jgi:hypothetical protein
VHGRWNRAVLVGPERCPSRGHALVALAVAATGIIALGGVWVHHMSAVGLSMLSTSLFSVVQPTAYNFLVLPTVRGRDPLWDEPEVFEPEHELDGRRPDREDRLTRTVTQR